MRAALCVALVLLSCASTFSSPFKPCTEPYGDWIPFEELTDEFDGDALNVSKWLPHSPGWLGRQPGLFDSNVSVIFLLVLHHTPLTGDAQFTDRI